MLLLDGLIIFLSGYLSKTRLSILNYILVLTLLPFASIGVMIAEMKYVRFDFYGYIAVMLLTGVSFLSVWIFLALNGEYKRVELSMYFVTVIVVLISMALFALAEVLPNDIICLSLGCSFQKAILMIYGAGHLTNWHTLLFYGGILSLCCNVYY